MCKGILSLWALVTLVLTTLCLILLPVAAVAGDDLALWEGACAKIDAGDLVGAGSLLAQLLEQYPLSPKAPAAQLKLAYIKIKLRPDSTQEILDAFSLVRMKYPTSSEAAEALVRIGYLHSKTDTAQAVTDFTTFVSSYPGHTLAAEVQQSLGRLYLRTLELDKAEVAFDRVSTIAGAPIEVVEEGALQSGFVKIMKYYASRDRSYLTAAIEALGALTSSSKVNIRARADLGIAEAMLLQGMALEAREEYRSAAQVYSEHSYFKGLALYGVACCSEHARDVYAAVNGYDDFLAAQEGAAIAEKDAAWKSAALASTSESAQISVQRDGAWERLPGSGLVCESVYSQSKCLYRLERYDEAITKLTELVAYLPEATDLRAQADELLERCRKAIGGN